MEHLCSYSMSFLVSSALNFPFASLLNYLLSYLYFPHQFVKVHYLFWSQLFVSYIHCKHPSLFCDCTITMFWGFPGGTSGKESSCQCRQCRLDPWVGNTPWRRKWQHAPVFLPGKFHGQRSLAGYCPWGCRESDTTEQLSTHTTIFKTPFVSFERFSFLYLFFRLILFCFRGEQGMRKAAGRVDLPWIICHDAVMTSYLTAN